MNRRRSLLFAILLLAGVAGLFAFEGRGAGPLPPSETLALTVDLSDRRLTVLENGRTLETFPVTIGLPRHPTPTGGYHIDWLVWNPSWNPPDSDWARGKKKIDPGPDNPMGRVKMFFRNPAYYVHGTNNEQEIGQAASHGCVRMRNGDVIELARIVMEHGGEPKPPNWFKQVVNRFRDTREVTLQRPVPITISE